VNYYLLHTTYPILFLSVFARQLSLPVPATLFLLSAGALASTGKLSLTAILLVAILGCVLGDLIWFEAGRLGGKRVLRLLSMFAPDPSRFIRRSKTTLANSGLPVLLVAKFVPGLDGIAPPLVGMSGVSRWGFLIFDAGGSAFWSVAYTGAGFLFAEQLDKVTRYTSIFANTLILVLGVPLLCFVAWKAARLVRMILLLRPLTITPKQLKRRLESGEKIGVIDLLRFEGDPEGSSVIRGALRADPTELRRKRRVVVPENVDLVLYCGSKNSFVSARVALRLREHGIRRIRILEGGLSAWKDLGFPMSTELADPQAEMERLGIEAYPPLRHHT
jgi:membrane protein DedA with SNARE-associated domain/rhodanese-related sulfurtransferase